MRLNLQCHSATPSSAIESISAEWSLSGAGMFWVRYHVEGAVERVRLPEESDDPGRTDNLWQHSCFELFLKDPRAERYCEYNFSPSGDWAAYGFTGYREGMTPLALATAPEIFLDFSDTHIGLEAGFAVPDDWRQIDLEAGLSAVIELQRGEKSLWALAHPEGKPDFHHQDCYGLRIEAATRT
ncbi:DOMON-like domain-containing protein [Parasphingorhabdus sp.]|uniref:DOMON-like domain-containing protein n=1 Tax=Parasphingorhabdus sp. TaxID=2709688 RepID=UPI003002941D